MWGTIVFCGFFLFCAVALRNARQPLAAQTYQSREASLSELAYLAGIDSKNAGGGVARLADAWWAVLHHRGYLVGQDPFKLVTIDTSVDLTDLPEEIQSAAKMLRGKTEWKPVDILAAWRPVMAGTERSLMEAGWINHLLLWARQRFWSVAPLFAVIPTALLGIGLFDLPGWTFLLMVMPAIVVRLLSPRHELLTAGGVVRLAQARTHYAGHLRAPRDPENLYPIVALAGAVVLLGTPLSAHASPSIARHGEAGASGCGSDIGAAGWSGGSSSDGSGCGSSGCGD